MRRKKGNLRPTLRTAKNIENVYPQKVGWPYKTCPTIVKKKLEFFHNNFINFETKIRRKLTQKNN